MDIEGLKAVKTRTGSLQEEVFSVEGTSGYRRISLKITPRGAVAELLEGRQRPGIESGEFVPMAIYTPEIGDRVVRAMAKMHFGIEEAATGFTAVDLEMISRGFTVGTASGSHPVWIASEGSHFTVISKTEDGGLPSSVLEPCHMVFGIPNGRRVTVSADNLPAALKMLDSGQMPRLLNPLSDVEVEGAYLTEGHTFH